MIFTETKLKGSFIIEIEKNIDERGFFSRIWCANEMNKHGLSTEICQANISSNKIKGTLRGMHYQVAPYQETKIVQCVRGAIFDVIIDLRKDSLTYHQWFGVELSHDNHKMLYIPEDFSHGFITLTDNCDVSYLMSQFYHPNSVAGIRWNDPSFNIKWPIEPRVVSEKDKSYPNHPI